ncbi:hypothetical protein RI543_000699 [Arxiozyma heterogenica]|uniref:Uncharacterized protein n=1 Tax=Arxiozyma heterogenica TaxID=278026 RepID=A0AAN7ZT76_9SACH|nr:hypothetical protein RI543_000699 [Kazachstania heterogenica]
MILLQRHFIIIEILLNLLIFSNKSTVVAGSLINDISSQFLALYKRDDSDTNTNSDGDTMAMNDVFGDSSWQWGRWILFILFIIGFFAVFFLTFTANRRRINRGEAPIRGTSWITPPSYRQSEQQYHGTTQRVVEDYVPEYTEEANINDLGYYDERGQFHPNTKAEYLPPPPLEPNLTSSPTVSSAWINKNTINIETPSRAVVHENEVDYTRPSFAAQQYYNMSPPIQGNPLARESQANHIDQNNGIQEYATSQTSQFSSETTISTHVNKTSIKANVNKEN